MAKTLKQFEPSHLSKESIYKFAEIVTQHYGLKTGGDLDQFVEGLGGKIKYVSYNEWEKTQDGSIEVKDGGFKIYLSNFTSPTRDRFTLAHELGHYFVHSKMSKIDGTAKRYTRGKTERVEWEANWFAAGFLIPTKEIKKSIENSWSAAKIAEYYNVSIEMAQHRIDTFNKNKF